MKKLLQSIWFIAFLALFVNLGFTGALIMMRMGEIMGPPPKPHVADLPEDAHWQFWSFRTSELEALVNEIRSERQRLDSRAEEIATMEARLQAEQLEVERLREEVVLAREELAKIVIRVEDDEIKNLKSLAATYSAMDPRNAISAFTQMEDDFVTKILSLMKPDSISPIFEQMLADPGDPAMAERVARLSEKLRLKEDPTREPGEQ